MENEYKITFDWWEAKLKIKDDEKTRQHMKDQLLFFINGQDLIDQEDGDIVRAYLQQVSPALLRESMDWNIEGVKDQIADNMYEGFLPIDGRFGVTLVAIDNWEFGEQDLDIEKITQPR